MSKWKPFFNPANAQVSKTMVWIRLPGLPVEFFDPELLMDMGNMVDRAIKVDEHMLKATRGKYARICVELDLESTLTPQIKLKGPRDYLQKIEYEGLYAICFGCGKSGHKEVDCTIANPEQVVAETNEKNQTTICVPSPSEERPFGPWLIPTTNRRRRPLTTPEKPDHQLGGQKDMTQNFTGGQSAGAKQTAKANNRKGEHVSVKQAASKQGNLMHVQKDSSGSRFQILDAEEGQERLLTDLDQLVLNFTQAQPEENSLKPILKTKQDIGPSDLRQRRGVQIKNKPKAKIAKSKPTSPTQENKDPNHHRTPNTALYNPQRRDLPTQDLMNPTEFPTLVESLSMASTKRTPTKKEHQPQVMEEDHNIKDQPPDKPGSNPTSSNTMEVEEVADPPQLPEWVHAEQNDKAIQETDMDQEQADLQPTHKTL